MIMRIQFIDALGMTWEQTDSIVDLAAPGMKTGEILEIWGDCPTFEPGLRSWCRGTEKTILSVEEWALMKRIQVQF
jgi:TusA-related sulfurtransferase